MAEDKKKKSSKTENEGKKEIVEPIEQTISLFLAIGLIIGALVIGLAVGYVVAPKGNDLNTNIENGQTAPALTPDQVEGGQLPQGHPQIPSGTGASSATTEGAGATQTP